VNRKARNHPPLDAAHFDMPNCAAKLGWQSFERITVPNGVPKLANEVM
jgi:hypothetical protein